MEGLILKGLFCEQCKIQFGNNFVFDTHMTFAHKKNKNKAEPESDEELRVEQEENNVINPQSYEQTDLAHTYGFFHSCTDALCNVHDPYCENLFPQMSHLYNFFPS